MSRYHRTRIPLQISLCFAAIALAVTPASADRIVIVGSDAGTFHRQAAFATDLRDYLQGGSMLPVLLLGDSLATDAFTQAVEGQGVKATASLASVDLSPDRYSALIVLSTSDHGPGCCNNDDARVAGFQSRINTYLGAGGALGIQNYIGEATYDPILHTTLGASGSVYGFLGGRGGTIDYDDEVVTAAGIAAGFKNYPAVGAWGHQGYDMNFFTRLGFTSLINAPAYGSGVSAVLATDVVAPVPEPSSLLLLTTGLAAGAAKWRRHVRQQQAAVASETC